MLVPSSTLMQSTKVDVELGLWEGRGMIGGVGWGIKEVRTRWKDKMELIHLN